MEKNDNWGIDLLNRKMWYEPWAVDQNGKYRNPDEKEKDEIFCCSGEAINETLLYFEEIGGDTQQLIIFLNDHVIDSKFEISREELFDSSRWYNNEYYFYFIMFSKKVIGRYDFHFGENSNEALSIHHSIYEKGYINKIPWGLDEKNNLIRDYSSENFCGLHDYIMNNFTNSEKIISDLIDFLNLVLIKKKMIFDISYFVTHNYWFRDELLYYYNTFITILTNNNKIIYKTNQIGLSNVLKSMGRVLGSIKNVYKHIPQLARKFNNIFKYKIVKLSTNSCILKYYCDKNYKDKNKYFLNIMRLNQYGHINVCRNIPNELFNSKISKFMFIKSYASGDEYFEGKFIWKNKACSLMMVEIITNLVIVSGFILYNLFFFNLFHNILFFIILILLNISYFFGKKFFLLLNFMKIFQKDIDKINISKDKLTARLQNEMDMLEDKVYNRTKELAEANENLKLLDKTKTDFFANVSHELRSPLTLILGYINAIKEEYYGKKIDASNNTFNIIRNNAYKLLKHINNILDFSKIKAGKMEIKKENSDISNLIRIFISNIEYLCKRKQIELIFTCNIKKANCLIDKVLFETVFFNLFSNAFKFTPEGGRIIITLDTEDDYIVLSVEDTGIGIPNDKFKMIFDRFTQVDTSSVKEYEGTGIGLALVKEIIELHDGRISVKSELSKGSTFKINIPLYREVKQDSAEKEFQIKQENIKGYLLDTKTNNDIDFSHIKKNILIVEDNLDMTNFLISILKTEYNINTAVNGEYALRNIDKHLKPDLILSDIMMPVMDGMTFYNMLKENELYEDVPFIFLTARADTTDKIKGLKKGAVDYIYKPFNKNELKAKINAIITCYENHKSKILSDVINKAFNIKTNTVVKKLDDMLLSRKISIKEKDIICLLVDGKEHKEIAHDLGLSIHTVRNHVQRIYKKFNLHNKLELMNYLK